MRPSDARHLSAEAQYDLRRRVIHAIVHHGVKPARAARVFGVARSAIYKWLQCFYTGGYRALAARPRGRPHESRLEGYQAATIVRLLTRRCPSQLQMPFALWTREAVQQLIAQRTGLHLSVWTVGRYLKRWGFTPQKPLRRAYPTGKGRNLLGRRDGSAVARPTGPKLRTPRGDASDSWNGSALRLQSDFDD